jgi:hypothetical protein
MKFFVVMLTLVGAVYGLHAGARSGAKIDWTFISDKEACANGRISMDIEVTVNGERFKFSPSCRFSFDKKFSTKSGTECEIEAGMCSNFSPRQKIFVKCSDGSNDSVDVKCSTK